jgi:hypothetical protein
MIFWSVYLALSALLDSFCAFSQAVAPGYYIPRRWRFGVSEPGAVATGSRRDLSLASPRCRLGQAQSLGHVAG